jgi:hypothetical protein
MHTKKKFLEMVNDRKTNAKETKTEGEKKKSCKGFIHETANIQTSIANVHKDRNGIKTNVEEKKMNKEVIQRMYSF